MLELLECATIEQSKEPESSVTEDFELTAVTDELQQSVQMEIQLPQQNEGHF